MGIITVLWEKWLEFRRDFVKITLSAAVTPIMYLIIFGIGIHAEADGVAYLTWLIPGLAAMSSMTGSFGAVTQNMSVQRLYEKALDQVMISPTPLWQFITGQIIGGSLRGLYASFVILLITFPVRASLHFGLLCIFILFLNGLVFSAIGLCLSFLAKSYADTPKFNSYIIVPMSFLCNTFFSAEQLPSGVRGIIGALPLSKTAYMVRSLSLTGTAGLSGIPVLILYFLIFTAVSCGFIYKKKNL